MAGTIGFLETLPLVEALWWFIENVSDDDKERTEVFFYLRERYRNEWQNAEDLSL